MPKFAPVGPLVAQRALAEAGVLGDYQLLIAPVVLRQMEPYAHFYREDYPDNHIIMDNGVVELGYPLDPQQLYTACRIVDADVVVLPDTIDDGRMTAKQARVSLPAWRRLSPDIKTLGVVQGKTLEECIQCARDLVAIGVDWLATSKYSAVNLGTRRELVRELDQFGLPIHVLGFSNNLIDDLMTTVASHHVRGIDSGSPIWSPKPYSFLPPDDEDKIMRIGRRPETFWTDPAAPHAVANVQMVQWWLEAALDLSRGRTSAPESTSVLDALIEPPAPVPLSET
jgi:hypothetical protein